VQRVVSEGGGVARGRVIKVECRCGRLLFKYYKGGRGRLIKCYLDGIRQDHVGILGEPTGSRPTCPGCGKELGVVRIIRGRPALKINQGTVSETRT
jgi:hypothetical protein